jgi:hypothetical protein
MTSEVLQCFAGGSAHEFTAKRVNRVEEAEMRSS